MSSQDQSIITNAFPTMTKAYNHNYYSKKYQPTQNRTHTGSLDNLLQNAAKMPSNDPANDSD
jgi:hypothetical protein